MAKNEVVKTENTAVADLSAFAEYAGAGLEQVSAQDINIPYIQILQSGSPQCKKGNEKRIDGATEGDVIATGVQHTVREFTTLAFKYVGIDLEWKGEGVNEQGIDKATGKVLVEVSEEFYRPTDVVNLWGDPTKAKTKLGWNPQKTSYEELCRIMAEHDLELAKQEAKLAE